MHTDGTEEGHPSKSTDLSGVPVTAPGFCGACVFLGDAVDGGNSDRSRLLKRALAPIWRRCRYLAVAILRRARGDRQGLVYVDPLAITHTVAAEDKTLKRNSMWHFGSVAGGDWDLGGVPVNEYGNTYTILTKRLHMGMELDAIPEFQENLRLIEAGHAPDVCRTEAQYRAKWRCIEFLALQIKANGYRTQRELSSGHPFNEIRVQIGRHGDMLFEEGIHRLVIAQVLRIKRIPVIVTRRHAAWIAKERARPSS